MSSTAKMGSGEDIKFAKNGLTNTCGITQAHLPGATGCDADNPPSTAMFWPFT